MQTLVPVPCVPNATGTGPQLFPYQAQPAASSNARHEARKLRGSDLGPSVPLIEYHGDGHDSGTRGVL